VQKNERYTRAEATCALGNEIAWMLPCLRSHRLNTRLLLKAGLLMNEGSVQI
jgi:hypothetical protein